MRLVARLASVKFALLPRTSTTSGTTDSECLFWAEFFFHRVDIMPQTHVQEWSILNSSRNYSPGIVYSHSAMQKFGYCPHVIGNPGLHHGLDSEAGMNAAEIVIREMQGARGFQIQQFLAESIRQSRKSVNRRRIVRSCRSTKLVGMFSGSGFPERTAPK